MIRHEEVQAALSARIDGEQSLIDDAVVDAHLSNCTQCQAFFERALALSERLNGGEGEMAPPQDLSAVILAGVDDEWRRISQQRALTLAVGKVLLGVMTVVWVVWAVRLLVSGGDDPVAASAASVRLGVALALGVTAWRPAQIPGVLLIVGTMCTFNIGYALREAVLSTGASSSAVVFIPLLTLLALTWTWAADRGFGLRRWWRMLSANPQ